MAITDESLLNILQAHGQTFLDSFGVQEDKQKRRKRTTRGSSESGRAPKLAKREIAASSSSVDSSNSAEEWTGFGSDTHMEDDESHLLAGEVTPLEASTSIIQKPDVIVFSGSATKLSETSSTKAQGKSFMSSKVSQLSDQKSEHRKRNTNGEDEDDEITNAQNDALLHRLVHTQLLSGSLNPELNLTSAQRKKALEGRVLELAGTSKLGQGEKTVRAKERDKASKRVREGMVEKQKQRREKLVQEAKEMGNYYPASKRLFQDPSEKNTRRSRERGLRMGVGSFGGGMLRLSKREIETVQDESLENIQVT
ncbi:hypothetical protein EDB92DRAFT_1833452 [Lactarius akahatsu]|uniref:Uncharacterized protein n=1 Tax=Lactarius akahatsu TaxID=416441 RepID=A0AAD4LR44_9AGAM|nr:hypothetical protein EDB92DRAFT_1833452 [Lactarius akahatsu]